jgi:1-deoxy-D-xylulose-5-phosphate reductoisomerase
MPLAAGRNIHLLKRQIETFKPQAVSVADENAARQLRALLGRTSIQIFSGEGGLLKVARWPGAQQVISAISGSAGLAPTMEAIEAGKSVAIANGRMVRANGNSGIMMTSL